MNAKLLFFCTFFLLVSSFVSAQNNWTSSGNDIYYSKGKVGIGRGAYSGASLIVGGGTETDNLTVTNLTGRGLTTYLFNYNNQQMGDYAFRWTTDTTRPGDGDGYTFWLSSWSGIKFFTQKKVSMVITGPGNVGIGTNNPGYKLDVVGTIRSREVIVNTNGADFVFEDNYELLSLDEVESHIQEKKHLPGIPSAKEMQENGVGISELNTKLLQKIEELTLYTIQQQKTIDELVETVKELKNINE